MLIRLCVMPWNRFSFFFFFFFLFFVFCFLFFVFCFLLFVFCFLFFVFCFLFFVFCFLFFFCFFFFLFFFVYFCFVFVLSFFPTLQICGTVPIKCKYSVSQTWTREAEPIWDGDVLLPWELRRMEEDKGKKRGGKSEEKVIVEGLTRYLDGY